MSVTPPGGPTPPQFPLTPPTSLDLQSTDILSDFDTISIFGLEGQRITGLKERLTIKDLDELLQQAQREFKDAIIGAIQGDIAKIGEIFDSIVDQTNLLDTLSNQLSEITDLQLQAAETQNPDIENFNTAATDYNDGIDDGLSQDQFFIDKMNNAIDDFNNNIITESEFNTIAGEYNTFMNTRNTEIQTLETNLNNEITSFNDKIPDFNDELTNINSKSVDLGGTELPLHETRSTVSTPLYPIQQLSPGKPVPQIQDPNLTGDQALRDLIPDLDPAPLKNTTFVPVVRTITTLVDTANQILDAISADFEDEVQLLFGKKITLPVGFLRDVPKIFLSVEGTGGSVGLVSLLVGLSSPALERILSRSLFEAIALELRIPLPERLFDKLEILELQLLLNAAIVGAMPAARLLSHRLAILDESSPAFKTVVALTIIQQILELVGTDAVEGGIEGLVKNSLGTIPPKKQLKELVDLIAAGVKLSFLQVSLALLGRALGLSGLLPLLFAKLGLSTVDILTTLNAGANLSDVLESPLSMLFLKSSLTDILILKQGFTSEKAASLVNTAINNALGRGPFLTASDLREALLSEFQEVNLSITTASKLANEALDHILANLGVPFLNVAFHPTFNQNLLATPLINLLVQLGFDPGGATNKVNNAILNALEKTGDIKTQREFRDLLIKELRDEGLTRREAIFIGNRALFFLVTGSVPPVLGIMPEKLDALKAALNEEFDKAQIDEALGKIQAGAPFFTEAGFILAFKTKLAHLTGSPAALAAFDRVAAKALGVVAPEDIGGFPELFEQVRGKALELLTPTFGGEQAAELTGKILVALFGASTLKEAKDQEQIDPRSLLNLIRDQFEQLEKIEDSRTLDERKAIIRDVAEHVAAISFVLNEVYRPAAAFFGSLAAGFGEGKRSIQIWEGV